MTPPSFSDLGKDARDLLTKGFYLNVCSIKCDTAKDDMKLKSSITHSLTAKKIAFSFEPELKVPKYNVTLSKKWSTDNVLEAELSVKDTIVKDIDQTFKISWNGHTDTVHANITNVVKKENVRFSADMFFRSAIPEFSPSLVLRHLGYTFGVDCKLDNKSVSLQRLNLAVGYSVHDFCFHGLISDWARRYSANIYQRLTDRLELAGSVSWGRDKEDVAWSVGAKYVLHPEHKHSVKAKVDHLNRVCVSLNAFLSKGLQLTLSSMFNNVQEPAQLGLAVEYSC